MGTRTGAIHIGTSGWSYNHWRGPFYPETIRSPDMLRFYAGTFDTVEINNSFYHLPLPSVFERWRESTPERFLFSVKASRYITHIKRLRDPLDTLERFLDAAEVLEHKLGPILFQLPPRWPFDPDRLAVFLDALPSTHTYVFEFRDQSWHCDEALGMLREHECAFCIYELAGVRSPLALTASTVYVRLHGPDGSYAGSYSPRALRTWTRRFEQWASEGRDVYCYFDNDQLAYAAKNAESIRAYVARNA
jgi:uncharacterized protein YecE (DUF72 family)